MCNTIQTHCNHCNHILSALLARCGAKNCIRHRTIQSLMVGNFYCCRGWTVVMDLPTTTSNNTSGNEGNGEGGSSGAEIAPSTTSNSSFKPPTYPSGSRDGSPASSPLLSGGSRIPSFSGRDDSHATSPEIRSVGAGSPTRGGGTRIPSFSGRGDGATSRRGAESPDLGSDAGAAPAGRGIRGSRGVSGDWKG